MTLALLWEIWPSPLRKLAKKIAPLVCQKTSNRPIQIASFSPYGKVLATALPFSKAIQ